MSHPANLPAAPLADEIDLRQYVEILVRRWPWIVVPTLVAALVAAVLSFFVLSPIYEATVLVTITPPKYLMQFSPEFRTIEQERIQTLVYSNLPELAMSDELVQQVWDSLQSKGADSSMTLSSLRNQMEVEGTKELALIYLRVHDADPSFAAEIANTWAELYIQELNILYGTQGTEYAFFVEQFGLAQTSLLNAQEAMVQFKARDRSNLLSSELAAKTSALNKYLGKQNEIRVQLQDIDGWLAQLAAQSSGVTVSRSEEVATFLMQLEVLGLGSTGGQAQFQIPLDQIAEGRTVAAQVAYLSSLRDMLQARLTVIDAKLAEIEPEVLDLQGAIQEAANENDRLAQEIKLTRSLQESLALKTEEARISTESQAGVARLASHASVPEKPIGPRRFVNTALGGALGLCAGLALVVLVELIGSLAPDAMGKRVD